MTKKNLLRTNDIQKIEIKTKEITLQLCTSETKKLIQNKAV